MPSYKIFEHSWWDGNWENLYYVIEKDGKKMDTNGTPHSLEVAYQEILEDAEIEVEVIER